jgi:LEA14-like dessication related protein
MRDRRSWVVVWGAFAVMLTLSGCRSLAKAAFIPPEVAVADTKVRNISLRGGALDVVLRVENPNDFRLDVSGVRYVVWVDSTQVATGTVERLVTLPPRSATTVEVPVEFVLDALRVVMVRFVSTGSVPYRVTGEFQYVTPFGRITRPFESGGTVRR